MGEELDIFTEVKKMGRPSKFHDVDLEMVEAMVRQGMTDRLIAVALGVNMSTWYLWQLKHPHFSDMLGQWKEFANERVKRSLYERAVGYDHYETKFFTHLGKVTSEKVFVRHIPPDPGAAKLWLTNRDPSKWKDRREDTVEHIGGITLSWQEPTAPVQQPPTDWLD